ncbi:PRD domain-containing protein [Cellulomonas fimi]|uniref:PRD domain-containing protein n=1 Tax=Cellulomonas sp. RIT-PI-Y TaxID=3035297 RepID=UPI0021DB3BA1
MRVRRILNNNVVGAVDAAGREVIVVGKAIGFRGKPGDVIDETRVESVFRLRDDAAGQHFASIMATIPPEIIQVTADIVTVARRSLGHEFGDGIFPALADHLVYAVQRVREGISLANPLAVEVRTIHRDEYLFARSAVMILNKQLGVEFTDDEAVNIALHFVNATVGGPSEKTDRLMAFMKDVLSVVRRELGIADDDERHAYLRFATHLRFLAQRVVEGQVADGGDPKLHAFLREQQPRAFACVDVVARVVEERHGHVMTLQEQTYLGLHLSNLL